MDAGITKYIIIPLLSLVVTDPHAILKERAKYDAKGVFVLCDRLRNVQLVIQAVNLNRKLISFQKILLSILLIKQTVIKE